MSKENKNPESDGKSMNEKPGYMKQNDESVDELTKAYQKENDQHYSTDTSKKDSE
ncbi:hypothetical protein [Nonlabens antarcticus]|uniref:hypothetical protein n=1 Tax=Nonlabens antarcticus TaxID=392714 RepID=UPI001890FB32|nr:hypothetical protein [Nonlabens antarcticus]